VVVGVLVGAGSSDGLGGLFGLLIMGYSKIIVIISLI